MANTNTSQRGTQLTYLSVIIVRCLFNYQYEKHISILLMLAKGLNQEKYTITKWNEQTKKDDGR